MSDRPDDRHLAGAAPAEVGRLSPERKETVAREIDSGNCRLVDYDAMSAHGDESACSAEIDGDLGAHGFAVPGIGSIGRTARLQSVPPSQVSCFHIGAVAFKVSIR